MKRSPLKRGKPIARKPMRRRPRSTKYSRRERNWDYMGWIRTLPCICTTEACSFELTGGVWRGGHPGGCSGPVEDHHAGEHGYGEKAPDDTCIPMCTRHHEQLTNRRLVFGGWDPRALKEWELAMIKNYQRRWDICWKPGAPTESNY